MVVNPTSLSEWEWVSFKKKNERPPSFVPDVPKVQLLLDKQVPHPWRRDSLQPRLLSVFGLSQPKVVFTTGEVESPDGFDGKTQMSLDGGLCHLTRSSFLLHCKFYLPGKTRIPGLVYRDTRWRWVAFFYVKGYVVVGTRTIHCRTRKKFFFLSSLFFCTLHRSWLDLYIFSLTSRTESL